MAVIAAAVVPHAPLIALGRAPVTEAATRSVLGSLPVDAPWILVSPHGSATAVRAAARGSLAAFGIPHDGVAAPTDPDLAARLAAGWTEVAPPDPADQAIVVPLALGPEERTVVPLSFAEVTGPSATAPDAVVADAKRAGDALAEIGVAEDVVLVASAHTAAALTPRAPVPERHEGHQLHAAVLDALRSGAGMEDIPVELWRAAASCGAAPLLLLARLCAGWRFDVVGDEAPFGVGYVAALSVP